MQAALSADPENETLKKLEAGLQEMIALSTKLVQPSKSEDGSTHSWSVGEECEAVWSEDGKYYKARIDKISSDGLSCNVTFLEYGNAEVVTVASLRSLEASQEDALKHEEVRKHALESSATDAQAAKRSKSKKEQERKHRREKALKWAQKVKEVEKAQESVQQKWKSFSDSGASKTKLLGTFTKKSIFATPDNPEGKVGVGTCGIGGRGMTSYAQRGKYQYNEDEEK